MNELIINRYFKHKFFNQVIKTTHKKGEDGSYHLYIELVSGNGIQGMSGSNEFMLATSLRENEWGELLNDFVTNNQYLNHNPFAMSESAAYGFFDQCRRTKRDNPSLRIGQVLINSLGDQTPTPNPLVFNSDNECWVSEWFFDNYIE